MPMRENSLSVRRNVALSRSANHRLRLFRLSLIFRLLFGFELLHYVRCIFFGGNLIWLGIYRTY